LDAFSTQGARLIAPLLLLLVIGVLANIYLYSYYRKSEPGFVLGSRWVAKWQLSGESLGGFSYGQLALISVLSLFLELLLIRWVSSEIRLFAYFKNFVLMACFLGFGLGCYLCRRRINLFMTMVPLLVIALFVQLPWVPFRELVGRLPMFLGVLSQVNFWSSKTYSLNTLTVAGLMAAIIVVVLVFGLITFALVPLGQLVGWYLENARKGILGYTVNIAGSLVGILFYTALCFLNLPPAAWLLSAGGLLAVFLWRARWLQLATASVFLICAGMASFSPGHSTAVYWSPYQKLAITPEVQNGEIISYVLNTNGNWYQHILNLSNKFVATHPQLFTDVQPEWNTYNVPYHFCPSPGSVLVLGAGTGNDVAAALRNGASRVVAVEIDPLILRLGRRLHFEKPYDSPRVSAVTDDARSYLQTNSEQFDLIMFSLLDSHTTSSHFTNIRIDNYVYTLEALREARRHLSPNGLMVVKFQVSLPWIAGRLYSMLDSVFQQPPVQFSVPESIYSTQGTFFISGSPERIAQAIAEPRLAEYLRAHPPFPMDKVSVTTDDWPYFYQRDRGIPATVVLISITLVAFCWFFLRQTGITARTVRWHFFFLGAGFFLLEAQIVSKMALLFGTTWAVNSIVISGLLLLIIAANVLVEHLPQIPVAVGYAGIFASILLSFSIPLEAFFFRSVVLKSVLATLTWCLPVFFAGIVFIRSFAENRFRGEALGSNLLGALVGGLLESLSYWSGIRSLLVLAAVLYFASWIASRVLADARQLAPRIAD
jgi:spermidine synthase